MSRYAKFSIRVLFSLAAISVVAFSDLSVAAAATPPFPKNVSSKAFSNTRYVLWTHPTTSPGSLLVVGVSYMSADAGAVTRVRYAGLDLTKLAAFEQTDSVTAELWYLAAVPVGSSQSLSVSFTGLHRSGAAGAISWTGADLVAPFGTPVTVGGNGTAPSVLAASQAGESVQDVLAWTGTAAATVGTGQVSRWNLLSGNAGGTSSSKLGAAPSTRMAWSLSASVNWAHLAVSIKPDLAAPISTVLSPLGSASVAGNVVISGTAEDNTAVAGVQFQVDAKNVGTEDPKAPYTTVWNSRAVPDGPHVLKAIARDTSNNSAPSPSVTVIVDNTAPVVSNGLPAGYVPTGTTTVTLSVNTNENATCKYDDVKYVPYSSMTKTFSTTGGTLHQVVEQITTIGTYDYYVRCADNLGNEDQSDYTVTFYMTTTHYASPTGSATSHGSLSDPWDLQTAFDSTFVKPGDTLYIRGGVYSRPVTIAIDNYIFRSNLQGTPTSPIYVRPFPGEQVTLDGRNPNATDRWHALVIRGSDTWFYDLEVTDSQPTRLYPTSGYPAITGDGVTIHAPRTKVINFIVHDNSGNGIGLWDDSPGSELYGTLSFNNGLWQNDGGSNPSWYGGWGHGVYTQNQGAQTTIKDGLFFHNFSTGVTPHGTNSAYLNNYNIEGNVIFENGELSINPSAPAGTNYGRNFWWSNCCPTQNVAQNPRIVNNHLYYTNQPENSLRGSMYLLSDTDNAVIQGNYMMRGQTIVSGTHNNMDFSGNTIFGQMTNPISGNTYLTVPPIVNSTVIRPNQYDPKRAHIVVYNWLSSPLASIDISSLGWPLGATYELRNAQDYFNDVITGTYMGLPVVVPFSSRSTAPLVNWITPVTTFPEFGAFVLVRTN